MFPCLAAAAAVAAGNLFEDRRLQSSRPAMVRKKVELNKYNALCYWMLFRTTADSSRRESHMIAMPDTMMTREATKD